MSLIKFDRRPVPLDTANYPRRIRFTKMEGAGNDYIYMEEFNWHIKYPGPLAVRMSDRNFGIGGDGIVLIGPPEPGLAYPADFRMRMFNADGSESPMCGNASRCVGKYLYDNGLTDKTVINLQTGAGLRVLELHLQDGKVAAVRVNMGSPRLEPEALPMLAPVTQGQPTPARGESFADREITAGGKTFKATAVSMGNPHLVVPYADLDSLDISALGPAFETHEWFPQRVNTEFIQVMARERIRMRVWERGSGETLACGTGACAALVACAINNWTARKAVVELRGGELQIEWAEDGNVYMTGPAEMVFTGEYIVR